MNRVLPDSFPLAAEQRGLWYVQQLAPDCGAFHLVCSAEVIADGNALIDFAGLLAQLIADYPILRTALPLMGGEPRQLIYDTVAADIRSVDAVGVEPAQLQERLRDDSRLPFDLALPPLWRVHHYRLGGGRALALLVVHHILLDFWSLGLLLQEVAGRLGMREGARPWLDGGGFGDYALRQASKDVLAADLANARDYWHRQLQDAPPLHGMPLDYPRPALLTYEGRSLSFSLSRNVSDGLKRLAQRAAATPFMVLLGVYFVLLHRYSGDSDIVVASPFGGRTEREQRNMLGQFVNTVALRAQIDPDMSFAQWLGDVKRTVVDALRHQHYPFSLLVEALSPQRDASFAPLAQLGFSWERLPLLADFAEFFMAEPASVALSGPGFSLRPYAMPQQEGQLDLLLEMGGERDGAFVGVLKYHERLFNKASAAGLIAAFRCLAEAIAADPDTRIGDLALVDAQYLPGILSHAMSAPLAVPPLTVAAWIRQQARATPEAPAVADNQMALTYQALQLHADQLASSLQQCGVTPACRVGLLLARDCNLPVAILGIWAAGAAYVPLDPALPAARLQAIADDAQLTALVSSSDLSALWPNEMPVVRLDQAPAPLPASYAPAAGETAYVIYTSGSTGQPKGVRIGERSLRNFLHSMCRLLQLDSGTRLLALTTHAFDISLLELLCPLLVGGTVFVCDRDTATDGARLTRRLQADRINLMQATPSGWQLLIDAGWPGDPGLRALCGGEALPPALVDALLPHVGELWNMYGPTETTVWSTAAKVRPGEPIHLGEPIDNTQLYVLDARQRPVPPGVPGELWIGGAGLALDYWRRPELTARCFTALPSLPTAGRLYRTGDRVCRRTDGLLTQHGRLDFQIKLRGYRIEPGEIESVLRRQPGIGDAVVILRESRPGVTHLVAYLTGEPIASASLAAILQATLPAYMVPSAFLFLDALPRNANGKLDRKALPVAEVLASAGYVAPRDAVEIQLAGLFADVLALPQVGIHDDFFMLGGHSLLAVRLAAGVKRLFGSELPISTLLQHGNVAALAAYLRGENAAMAGMALVLRAGQDIQPLWLFHPIGGSVFCYLELARCADPRRPILAFEATGLQEGGEAEVTVEALAGVYLAALRERQPHGPYLLGGWCFGGVIAFEAARQLRAASDMVQGVVLIDTRAPIAANVPSHADDATLLSWFARDLAVPYGKVLNMDAAMLRALPAEDMFDRVLDAARAIDVLPADADIRQLQRYFEVYLANGIALQTYFPPADELPLLLLRAADEPADYGPTLGWSELAPASLTLTDLPGDHSSIMYPPQADAVARAIDAHFSPQPLPEFSP